jgi:dephospho-CoA kinase
VNIHALHISRSEQIERIRERNGDIDEYQLDRIKQSRRDLEGVMNALNPLVESSPKHKIRYKIKWYKQEDGQFVLDREY